MQQALIQGYQKKDEPYKAEVIALTEKLITLLPYNTIAIKAS